MKLLVVKTTPVGVPRMWILKRILKVTILLRRVNAEVVNVHALLQIGNAIQMFVGIVGSGEIYLLMVVCAALPVIFKFHIFCF